MREIVLDEPASEASSLLAIRNSALLEAEGWDLAFWTCSDEDPVEEALGILARRRDHDSQKDPADGWEHRRIKKVRLPVQRKTEDCEALARQGDWIYVVGSHYGAKGGQLEPGRHFIARFNETQIQGKLKDTDLEIEIARGTFKLHRLLNDGLRASGLQLLSRGKAEEKTLRKTLRKGEKNGKKWAERLREDDWPLNVEGAEFRDSGSLLLGLRYPVTVDGHPILAEIGGVEKLFADPPEDPTLLRFWVLGNVGTAEEPRGIRALDRRGRELHVITGNLDSLPEQSAVVKDHPEGKDVPAQHHRFTLPRVQVRSSGLIQAELIGDVQGETKVEGLFVDTDGDVCYVIDDEKIRLRLADGIA